MRTAFHVSSVHNRGSISTHGLDASRMGAARGIAGSRRPEADGVFLVFEEDDVDYFVRMNNTAGPVDVWQVDAVDAQQMIDNGSGYFYLPGKIPANQLTLIRRDLVGGGLFSR